MLGPGIHKGFRDLSRLDVVRLFFNLVLGHLIEV